MTSTFTGTLCSVWITENAAFLLFRSHQICCCVTVQESQIWWTPLVSYLARKPATCVLKNLVYVLFIDDMSQHCCFILHIIANHVVLVINSNLTNTNYMLILVTYFLLLYHITTVILWPVFNIMIIWQLTKSADHMHTYINIIYAEYKT